MCPTDPEAGTILSKQDDDIAAVYDKLAWIEHRADLFRLGVDRRFDRIEARIAGSEQTPRDLEVADAILRSRLKALDTFLANALALLDGHLQGIDAHLDEVDSALVAALSHLPD